MNLILLTNSFTSISKIYAIIPSKSNPFPGKITSLRFGLFIGASAIVGMIAMAVFFLIKHIFSIQRKLEIKDIVDSSSLKKDSISTNTDSNSLEISPRKKEGNIASPQNVKSDPQSQLNPVESIIGGAKNYYNKGGKLSVQDLKVIGDSLSSTQTLIPNPISDSTVNPPEIEKIQEIPTQTMTKQWVLKTIRLTNIDDLKNEIANCKGVDKLEIFLPKVGLKQKYLDLDVFKEIAKTAPNLESLTLIGNDENGFPLHLSQGFNSIFELKNLNSLQMENISAGKLSLSRNDALETLEIKNCIFKEFPSEIKDLKNLQKLSIARNLFDESLKNDELEKKYADLLSGLKKSLIEASLQDFRLKKLPEVLEGDSLEEFLELKELDLKGNPFDVNPEFPKKRIDQNILIDDISQISKGLVKPGQNVLVVGRTRSGKSTLMNVLANKLDTKPLTLFSETKGSSLSTLKFPDLEVDGKPARINFHDTPGLFELRKSGTPRGNNELLETIREDHEKFFGGIGFSNVKCLVFTLSLASGLNTEDLDTINIGVPFLRRMGLPTTAQISLVITRAENLDKNERLNIVDQINKYPRLSTFFSENNVNISFSGGIKSETKDSNLKQELKFQENNVSRYRILLFREIFKGADVKIAPNVSHHSLNATIKNIYDGGVI